MYKEDLVYNLINSKNELVDMIEKIDQNLLLYRRGTLVKQNSYYYIKHYADGKVISTYVGKNLTDDEIQQINYELRSSNTLMKRKKEYLKELKELNKLIDKYGGKE